MLLHHSRLAKRCHQLRPRRQWTAWMTCCLLAAILALSAPAAGSAALAAPDTVLSGPVRHDGLANWITTIRDTTMWSGPDAQALSFGTAPMGSYLEPLSSDPGGRVYAYYTGDGSSRSPGTVWVSAQDIAPGAPPPWVVSSDVDGDSPANSGAGGPHRTSYAAPPVVTAQQIAIVDADSGETLYQEDAHTPEPPASTTKIVTAMVTLQHEDSLATPVRITVNGPAMAAEDGSSIMGLLPGQQLSLKTLLYGLLLPSGNDAAEQLALTVAGSRDLFVTWMNQYVENLGLTETHFLNPSGIDEDGHDASAHDLAMLGRQAMDDPTFSTIVDTPSYTGDGLKLFGHNPLLGEYPGTDGVKTGSTDAADHTMVASVTHAGHRVFVVVMHSDDLLSDCEALYDWTWSEFGW